MEETEKKIRQIMYKMTEKRSKEYPKAVFLESLYDVIRTQVYHGRLDPDDVPEIEQYTEMLLEEFYYEDTFEDNCEDDDEEGIPGGGL